jgi:hypothetical protein
LSFCVFKVDAASCRILGKSGKMPLLLYGKMPLLQMALDDFLSFFPRERFALQ